jgi:hypothetical protein
MPTIQPAPIITSCSWLDNEADDLELITISCSSSATIYPSYVKLIIDNVSATANSLTQKVIHLKNGDYTYNNGSYLINVPIPIIANKSYTIKAKLFYSDATYTPYSALKAFTSGPTTPVIVSAFGDAMTSIFISIQPQSEVLNYSAILAYKDYTNEQQLDVVDNITTTDNTKRFLKLTNLLQNVDYTINLIASNANGQSQISNSIVCSTKPVPDPVSNFTGILHTDGDIELSWSAPLNSIHLPVTKYRLDWTSYNINETNPILEYTRLFLDGSATSYLLTSNTVNLRYDFIISAIHSDVNDKNKDLIIDHRSTEQNVSVFIPEPSEVQSLSAQIDANTLFITLNWSAPANNNIISTYSYDVKFNGVLYQNILGTTMTYSSTIPSGTYSFEVIPLHKAQRSSQGKTINVQVPSTGAPVNLTSSYDKSCNIILNWSAPANNSAIVASSYNIYDASNTLIVSTTNLTYAF